MINIEEIEKEIEKLENCDCTTYKVCEKLSILYTVHDHFKNKVDNSNNMDMRTSTQMMNNSMIK